jgi:hypothetical protein
MSDDSDEYEYVPALGPPENLDGLIRDAFGLSSSPTHAIGDDDWSFVIKMHGYVETALNQLLVTHFNDPRLEKLIEKMGMGHRMQGKLGFTRALDLLRVDAWSFVKLLGDLRSEVVHKIKMLDLDLQLHLQTSEHREAWKTALTWWNPKRTKQSGEIALIYPKYFIFTSVMNIMTRTAVQTKRATVEHHLAGWLREVGEVQIFRRKKGKPLESSPSQSEEHHPPEAPGE